VPGPPATGKGGDASSPELRAKSVARIQELGLTGYGDPQILARLLFAVELHSIPDETALRRAGAGDGAESTLRVL
jgi:hypothetical protein